MPGLSWRAAIAIARLAVSSSLPATMPSASAMPASMQALAVGAEAVHDLEVGRRRLVGVDDRHVEAAFARALHHLGAEPAVAADDPVSGWRRHPRAEAAAARAGEPGQQAVGVGRAHGDGEALGELAVGVDDLGDAAGLERRHRAGGLGAGDRAQPRMQQPGGDRDREVGPVVGGQRQHADALALGEAGQPGSRAR